MVRSLYLWGHRYGWLEHMAMSNNDCNASPRANTKIPAGSWNFYRWMIFPSIDDAAGPSFLLRTFHLQEFQRWDTGCCLKRSQMYSTRSTRLVQNTDLRVRAFQKHGTACGRVWISDRTLLPLDQALSATYILDAKECQGILFEICQAEVVNGMQRLKAILGLKCCNSYAVAGVSV